MVVKLLTIEEEEYIEDSDEEIKEYSKNNSGKDSENNEHEDELLKKFTDKKKFLNFLPSFLEDIKKRPDFLKAKLKIRIPKVNFNKRQIKFLNSTSDIIDIQYSNPKIFAIKSKGLSYYTDIKLNILNFSMDFKNPNVFKNFSWDKFEENLAKALKPIPKPRLIRAYHNKQERRINEAKYIVKNEFFKSPEARSYEILRENRLNNDKYEHEDRIRSNKRTNFKYSHIYEPKSEVSSIAQQTNSIVKKEDISNLQNFKSVKKIKQNNVKKSIFHDKVETVYNSNFSGIQPEFEQEEIIKDKSHKHNKHYSENILNNSVNLFKNLNEDTSNLKFVTAEYAKLKNESKNSCGKVRFRSCAKVCIVPPILHQSTKTTDMANKSFYTKQINLEEILKPLSPLNRRKSSDNETTTVINFRSFNAIPVEAITKNISGKGGLKTLVQIPPSKAPTTYYRRRQLLKTTKIAEVYTKNVLKMAEKNSENLKQKINLKNGLTFQKNKLIEAAFKRKTIPKIIQNFEENFKCQTNFSTKIVSENNNPEKRQILRIFVDPTTVTIKNKNISLKM